MTLTAAAKILGIAFAVGLDVLALSIAVGVMRIGWPARIRLGVAFSVAEVLMQIIGYSIDTGAGRIVGTARTSATIWTCANADTAFIALSARRTGTGVRSGRLPGAKLASWRIASATSVASRPFA
jgi:hypothetical protein